jgi:hypothetical protein
LKCLTGGGAGASAARSGCRWSKRQLTQLVAIGTATAECVGYKADGIYDYFTEGPSSEGLGPLAFGEPPLIIYKGERLRWVNLDTVTHALVADTSGVPDFRETGELANLNERSFIMMTTGTTTFHCTIHPGMVGTLVVRDR